MWPNVTLTIGFWSFNFSFIDITPFFGNKTGDIWLLANASKVSKLYLTDYLFL